MFRFSLEKVLHYRSRLVEREARKLRLIAVQLGDIHRKRQDLELACEQAALDESGRGDGVLDVSRFRHFAGWMTAQREYIRICDERAREVQVMLENQRSVLLRMKHDESVLVKLKQRHREAWALDEARKETKLMDEAGSRIHRREDGGDRPAGDPEA